MFSLPHFSKSVLHAWHGLVRVAREEQSFRIQLLAGIAVAVLMSVLDLSGLERAFLVLAITLVLVLELVNSIFERVADLMKPRIHQYVADIKDIMAAAVLVASIGAAIIGILIILPHLGIGPSGR
ncbi:diacylglycerol kinase [Candidatus Uhrbacteria bacterium]|nr:diacylglycerol kinase [Candidatus Uhrbacteria bacterium]